MIENNHSMTRTPQLPGNFKMPCSLIILSLLLMTAQHAPAPISEESTPTPRPTNAKSEVKARTAESPTEKRSGLSAGQQAPAAVSEKDKKFMTNLAHRVPEQMLLENLAEKQARSADVINFGKQAVGDRMALDKDLRALAARKNVAVPKENITSGLTSRLGGLAYGAGYAGGGRLVTNYDKRWLLEMERSLREDLADCADEFQHGSDPDVKAWAEKTFERLKKHLLTLTDIRNKLK
jgi:putative membrane protein